MKETAEQKKQSVLGAVSLVITILASLLFVGGFLFWSYCHSLYSYTDSLDRPIIGRREDNMVYGIFAISILLLLISVGLGIVGLFQRDKNKLMPMIGIIFSALAWIAVAAFFYFDVTP